MHFLRIPDGNFYILPDVGVKYTQVQESNRVSYLIAKTEKGSAFIGLTPSVFWRAL